MQQQLWARWVGSRWAGACVAVRLVERVAGRRTQKSVPVALARTGSHTIASQEKGGGDGDGDGGGSGGGGEGGGDLLLLDFLGLGGGRSWASSLAVLLTAATGGAAGAALSAAAVT